MNNHSRAIDATNTAMDSAGSGARENAEYLKSLEARINKLKNAWTEFAINAGDAFLSDGIIAFSEGLASITKSASSAIKFIGFLPPIVGTLTIAIMALNGSLRASTIAMGQKTGASTVLQGALTRLTVGATATGAAFLKMGAFMRGAFPPLLIISGITIAIEKLFSAFMKHREEQREIKRRADELTTAYSDSAQEIRGLVSEYENLSKKVASGDLSSNDERFLEVQQKLGDYLPHLVDRVDEKGQAHLRSASAIKEEISQLEELRRVESGLFLENFSAELKDVSKEIDEVTKSIGLLKNQVNSESITGGILRDTENLSLESQAEILIEQTELNAKLREREVLFKQLAQAYADHVRIGDALNQQEVDYIDLLIEENSNLMKTAEGQKELEERIKLTVIKLGDLKEALGDDLSLDIVINSDLDIDISSITKEQIDALSSIHSEIRDGGEEWDKYNKTLSDVGFEETSSLIKGLGEAAEEANKETGLFYDELARYPILIGDLNKHLEEGGETYNKYGEAVDDTTGYMQDQADSIHELISLHDQLLGSFYLNTDEVYNAIAAYDVLTMAYEEAADSGADLTHIENQLAETKEYLSSIFPHLVNGTELHIDAMAEEARQADILNHAIDLLAKGELSSQDARNLASAISTKARISHMQEEINALNRLATAHREIAKNIQDEIQRTGEGAYRLNHLLEHGSLPATSNVSMFQNAVGNYYQSTIENLQSAIDLEIPSLSQATDALAKNTDYKERNTRATKDNEKATKDANKEKEKEIFLADKHKKALDDLNREMSKQQNARNNLLRGSTRWQRAMKEEIRLTKEKREEIGRQIKELERLEQMGQVYQSGVVTASSLTGSSTSASNLNAQLKGKLAGTGDLFMKYGAASGIDPALLAAIAIHETGNGTSNAIRNRNNAFGIMTSSGLRNFSSVEESIKYTADLLARNYIGKGLTSIAQIGNKYAPVGAGNDPTGLNNHWVTGVTKYYNQLGGSGSLSMTSASSAGTQNVDVSKWVTGKTDGINPEVLQRLAALAMAQGKKINITSGYRSTEHQQRLWDASDKTGKMVARPGSSAHNHSIAVDIGNDWLKQMSNSVLQQFGLHKPMSYENWHIEPIETKTSGRGKDAFAAVNQQLRSSSGSIAQHQQGLFNQGQSIADMQAEQHSLYLQQQKLQEEYFHGLIENHSRTIAHLERQVEAQQNIVDRLPEGHKDRDAALNQINYLNSLIDKQLNEIQYKAGQFSNSTKISESGRNDFAVMRDEARLRREGVSLEQAERNADRVREKMVEFDRLIQQQEGSIARLQRERDKLVVGSNAYVASLEQESKHVAELNRLLGRQQEEYEKAINSGKLTIKDMQEFKTSLAEINEEIEIGAIRLAELRVAFIEAKMTQFDKRTQGIDRYVKRLSNELQYLDQGTDGYTERVDKQLAQLSYKQQTLHNQANLLRDEIASGMLTPAQVAEYEEMISDLGLAWWDVRHEIESVRQAQRDFIGSKLEEQKIQYIEGLQKAYEKLNKELEELIEKDEIFNTSEFLDNIDDLIYELDRIDERFISNAFFKDSTQELRTSLSQTRDEIISIANAVDLMTKKTSENKQELEQLIREQSAYANVIKNQIDALDKQIRDTQLNHKKIEDSLQNQIKLKQEQLQQLDKEEKQLDRNKRLQELLDEIEKVRNDKRFSYITENGEEILTYDRGRLKELEKQRDELLEQYERDDIREAMQDEINEMQNKLDKTKNIHQQEIAELNLQKNALNTLYNGLVADTSDKLNQLQQLQNKHLEETGKQWDELIKEVQKGTKDFDALMETFYADTLLSLGEFGNDVQNQINEIVQAFRSLGNMQLKAPQVSGGTGGTGGSPSTGGSTTPTGIDQMKQNSQAWANTTSQDERNRLAAENQQIGKDLGLSYNSGTGTWHTSDGLKAYHTGGIVGDSKPNKFTELMNKLLNTNANETVIKALNNELYSPQHNLAKFAAPNLKKLMGSIKPMNTQMLQPITENHYHLKDFTIKTDNAENFLSQIKHLTKSHKR